MAKRKHRTIQLTDQQLDDLNEDLMAENLELRKEAERRDHEVAAYLIELKNAKRSAARADDIVLKATRILQESGEYGEYKDWEDYGD